MEILKELLILIIGFFLLIKGADWFVDGASKIADKFHIPQLVIGLTIVAFGTSAPEAAVGLAASANGNADIALGNVVGSNILNILLILGITSLILPLSIQKSTLFFEVPFVIAISAVLLFLGKNGNQLSTMDGVVLWVLFIIFFIYLIQLSRKNNGAADDIPAANKNDSFFKLIIITIIGLISIVAGSKFTVSSASALASIMGLSERFIGLTIVAFGTSLPELITSIMAARKGKDEIAIGNVVGSNIFNILFILGTTSLLFPINYAQGFIFDNIICILSVLLLWLCVFKTKKLGRIGGGIMVICYIAYFINIL
ncbi:calcium/sodium antiporter [Anaeromicropila populeti]|uniref:Cation:H+ antiporter n=1 Tax=Anaeromicropila populeti TaxID=37658 RepID=A0A1I6L6F5_9FIRM|nr:calcium/sodium antiporter [Anaeromicropila populeti]SFR98830.1 cation:H+ antiporter [Anaeromicropila populeti]